MAKPGEVKIIFSEKCLAYDTPGHPESSCRVKNSYEFLRNRGFSFVAAQPAGEAGLIKVHDAALIAAVRGNDFFDPDTPAPANIYEYACLAAGAAIGAARMCMRGERVFSLMRPPGHHAGKSALGGFCYFNNMAAAVAAILPDVSKAAIIDIDVHHGNGTEDIFLGNQKVLFVSLHQSAHYPGTGLASRDNCLNFPLPAGTGEKEYLEVLAEALAAVQRFRPEIIGVSCGFDTFRGDSLGGFDLDISTYRKIGKAVSSAGKPVFSILEGGYSRSLGRCIAMYLDGIDAPEKENGSHV